MRTRPATMAVSGMLITTSAIALPTIGMPSNEPAGRPTGRPSNEPARRPTGRPSTRAAVPAPIGVVGGMAAAMLGEQHRRCDREQGKGKYREMESFHRFGFGFDVEVSDSGHAWPSGLVMQTTFHGSVVPSPHSFGKTTHFPAACRPPLSTSPRVRRDILPAIDRRLS